jgi:hypothetical protein
MARRLSLMAVAVLVAAIGPLPGTAAAVDQSKGHAGFCKDATGVTVVIDFQQLGGTTIVRCDPQKGRGTGLDALKNAGFQIAGVQRWGEAFICRVENRPSATEELPIKGNDHYRESCVDTPPASGYWSYWHAGNNCAWQYSQWGVKNRDFTAGGFEGWSYSLNATADSNPVPRIAAVRPGTTSRSCSAGAEQGPSSNDLDEQAPAQHGSGGGQPGAGGSDDGDAGGGSADGGGGSAGKSSLPPPKPRTASTGTAAPAPDPAANVTFTGGQDAPDVNAEIKRQSGASDYAPWVAGVAVLLLAAASWAVARRRKRAREA